jgi:hypothetical protein
MISSGANFIILGKGKPPKCSIIIPTEILSKN